MHPDRAFDPGGSRAEEMTELIADLDLEVLVAVMADGDRELADLARAGLCQPLHDADEIRYRQQSLADSLAHPDTIRRLHEITTRAKEVDRHYLFGWANQRPTSRLENARGRMGEYLALLREMRDVVVSAEPRFESPGFRGLVAEATAELGDPYLEEIRRCLEVLRFANGVVISARLGRANEGVAHVLRAPAHVRPTLREMVTAGWGRHTVTVAPRDIAGSEALADLKDRGLAVAAEALGQGVDHVKAFFANLRQELGFCLGCLHLQAALARAEIPLCVPDPTSERGVVAQDLREAVLALRGSGDVVGSDLEAAGAALVVVTGANQGGKSTFLRALGLAQILMQAGFLVPARAFAARPARAVYSHFIREEDSSMRSGKFDGELARMSDIVTHIEPGSLLLCNESFSATNEREAGVIGEAALNGFLDSDVEVRLVTHQYELAERLRRRAAPTVFVRAERRDDGTRSHRIIPGDPESTSHADDLYLEVFGERLPGLASDRAC